MLKNNKKCKAFFVFQKSLIFENHLNKVSYATSMPPISDGWFLTTIKYHLSFLVSMKILFIEAKYKGKVNLGKDIIDKLPKRIGLVSTVQFVDNLSSIKKQLEKNNKKIIIGGQILGCDVSKADKIKNKVDYFLYIGTGSFHPLGLAYAINKPVFTYSPIDNTLEKISEKEIESYKKRRKGAYIKFLSAKNIGILVSTKPGQNQLKKALALKKKLKDKNCYIFIADTIDLNELENFPFIEAWVNTACPRIVEDKSGIINIDEIV